MERSYSHKAAHNTVRTEGLHFQERKIFIKVGNKNSRKERCLGRRMTLFGTPAVFIFDNYGNLICKYLKRKWGTFGISKLNILHLKAEVPCNRLKRKHVQSI